MILELAMCLGTPCFHQIVFAMCLIVLAGPRLNQPANHSTQEQRWAMLKLSSQSVGNLAQ